jgi:hypothetical protein
MNRNSQVQMQMQKQKLIAAINVGALNYGHDNVLHYADFSREQLMKWAQTAMWPKQGKQSLMLDASDSVLSTDIINHWIKAARDFVQLINVHHT